MAVKRPPGAREEEEVDGVASWAPRCLARWGCWLMRNPVESVQLYVLGLGVWSEALCRESWIVLIIGNAHPDT